MDQFFPVCFRPAHETLDLNLAATPAELLLVLELM